MFESFKINDIGINFFVPKDMNLYKKGKPCSGFGQIKYAEGSIYTGEVYFDGADYHKLGYGKQDFTYSWIGDLNEDINQKIYLFVGQFDYRKTNWIYGNGTLYYRDANGKPSSFVKGFFSCLDKIGEYKGEYDYSLLIDGYHKDMEVANYIKKFKLIKSELDDLADIQIPETLFFGDSYFEFWHNEAYAGKVFKETFDVSKYLNIGVGGTKYCDWIELLDGIKHFPKFKNVVINLGFNDLHFMKKSVPAKVYDMMVEVIKKVNEMFDNPNIYILNVCHSPAYKSLHNKEAALNKMLSKNAKKLGVYIIDNSSAIYEKNLLENVFDVDNVHLNSLGYQVMYEKIVEALKNN